VRPPAVHVAIEDSSVGATLKELAASNRIRRATDRSHADLILVCSSTAHGDGPIRAIEDIRRVDPDRPIILAASNSSEVLAISALRAGANDYLRIPDELGSLLHANMRLTANSWADNATALRLSRLVGEHRAMLEIKDYIQRTAATDCGVLVTGETGTGKELVAAEIHDNSARKSKPFQCINCAAIPDALLESELFGYERGAFTGANSSKQGKLRMATGGTLFFDEIGDMSPYAQAKILRAIESKEVYPLGAIRPVPVDVRIIAATNWDLALLMRQGKFRSDLYFRLNVARIHLPPLRDRKSDIPLLIQAFVCEYNRRFGRRASGFAGDALAFLLSYSWPGNVRELKNIVEASFVDLPPGAAPLDLPRRLSEAVRNSGTLSECEALIAALMATNWNKSEAAQRLHWSRMTLYRKMAKYHIARESSVLPESVTPVL
jgi:DNA-binding NtrC family response regulator